MLEAPFRTETGDHSPRGRCGPASIGAVGMAVPGRVVTNEPIAARFGIDPGWIVERTGVRERRVLGEGETLLGLAAEAAEGGARACRA